MPLYSFRCPTCGLEQEHHVPMDTQTVTCRRRCNAPAERHGLSRAVPLTFRPYQLYPPGYRPTPVIDERTDKQLKAQAKNNYPASYDVTRDNYGSKQSRHHKLAIERMRWVESQRPKQP